MESLFQFGFKTSILLLNKTSEDFQIPSFVKIYKLSDIEHVDSNKIQRFRKKFGQNSDAFRWSMKPVFIKFLLYHESFDKVIYCDNDIYFFSSPIRLLENLDEYRFLLTPHFYSMDPTKNQNWFEANFRIGLYNAGFIACNSTAIPILNWWINCCLYNVKKSSRRGLFDDQKYLDLIPILFDNTHIIKEYGNNFASWNLSFQESIKTESSEIVFVHFTPHSIKEFGNPQSPFYSLYSVYKKSLLKNGFPESQIAKRNFKTDLIDFISYLLWRVNRIFEN